MPGETDVIESVPDDVTEITKSVDEVKISEDAVVETAPASLSAAPVVAACAEKEVFGDVLDLMDESGMCMDSSDEDEGTEEAAAAAPAPVEPENLKDNGTETAPEEPTKEAQHPHGCCQPGQKDENGAESESEDVEEDEESQGSQEAQEDFKSEFLASSCFNPFTRLSPEITLKVLESVGPTDLGQVAQTCSLMRTIAEDEKLWTGKCTEEGFEKEILNSKDLQILADRSSKEKSIKPSRSKANYSKHFTREKNFTRKPIREPTVIDGSGGSEISRVLELTHNKIIYVCGNTVKVWSAFTGEHLYTLAGHTSTVLTVQMNEEFIITGSMDSTLKVWSSTTGAFLRTLRGHTEVVCCSHLREDILVSGSWDKTVHLWDVREGTCINTLEGHEGWVRCVQFTGTVVASAGARNVIKIWDQEKANCLHTLRHLGPFPVEEIKFYHDLLVSASWDKTVKVWDIKTGGSLHTIPADLPFSWVSGYGGLIQLEENILVTKHQDTAKMWDIFTGRHLLTFAGPHKHTREITGVRIESKFVVTASDDGSIKIWNRKSGEFVRNLLQLEEGGKVLAMKMEDAKIVALTQKASNNKKEIIVLNFDIEY